IVCGRVTGARSGRISSAESGTCPFRSASRLARRSRTVGRGSVAATLQWTNRQGILSVLSPGNDGGLASRAQASQRKRRTYSCGLFLDLSTVRKRRRSAVEYEALPNSGGVCRTGRVGIGPSNRNHLPHSIDGGSGKKPTLANDGVSWSKRSGL